MLARTKATLVAAGVGLTLTTAPASLTAEPAAVAVAVPYLEEREYTEAELMALPPFDRCHVLAHDSGWSIRLTQKSPRNLTLRTVLEVGAGVPQWSIDETFRQIKKFCRWREDEVTLETIVPINRAIAARAWR